jgi:integrase
MATRVLELSEYRTIVELFLSGFTTEGGTTFRPNRQIALALQLQASLGLRIGDVLELRVNNFKNGKLETKEDKTDKLQYRDINRNVFDYIKDYAIEGKLAQTDKLFSVGVRAVQKQLKLITDYLGLENISTHSFRKMFATSVYEGNGHNLELVKELLNHTSIATTQRYIRVSQQAINKASAAVDFISGTEGAGLAG